jgi:hypothetical protein
VTMIPPNGPADRCASAVNDLELGLIGETVELAASYARSASEAAWRDDKVTLGVHLRQLRLCVMTAIQTFKELSDGPREKADAS